MFATRSEPMRFRSEDPAETIDVVERLLAPHSMHVPHPARMKTRLDYAEVACGKVVDLCYGADVTIRSAAPPSHYLIHALVEGSSSIERKGRAEHLSPGSVQITPPGSEILVRFGASSRHLTACVQRDILERSIGRHLGNEAGHPLALAHGHQIDGPWVGAWLDLLSFITSWQPMSRDAEPSPALRHSLGALMVDFIADNCTRNFQLAAPTSNGAVPWYVRRACTMIEADLKTPGDGLSLAGVADAVGVSVRSLQAGFSGHVGQTFTAYVRDRRLDMLDARLREAGADANVTTLMQSCGIDSPGRYASYYRNRFGRRPSDTLRRQKH